MANEFRIQHGLIVTGSSYFSESMYAPNLPEETAPDYYITWRQSDGRFEVTPKGAAASVLAIGCWDYAGYLTPTSTGEFSLRGNGSNNLQTALYLFFYKTDNTGKDQSSYFNNIGPGSILTFTTQNSIVKFEVTGVSLNGNEYSFSVTNLSGTEELTVGEEICLTATAVSSGGTSSSTSGTSGGGSSLNSSQCAVYKMTDSYSHIPSNDPQYNGTAIFNRTPSAGSTTGWAYPFGTINTNIIGIFVDAITYGSNAQTSVVYWSQTLGAISTNPSLIKISYLNLTTYFQAFIALGVGTGGQQIGTTGSSMYVDLTYVSGDTNYTIPTGATFTVCPA